MARQIVIVGGGFGGVTAAVSLARQRLPDTDITLISNKPYLEYYGALYRLIAGSPPAQVIIPLSMIIGRLPIRVIQDDIVSVHPRERSLTGADGKTYAFDNLILAPGSVPNFFHIPGMQELGLTLTSASSAMAIRRRVLDQVKQMAGASGKEREALSRFAVIGAGPTGIEIAGEVTALAKKAAKKLGMHPAEINVQLVEAADRVLPTLAPDASREVMRKMQRMKVRVHLKEAVSRASPDSVDFQQGGDIATRTIFWTAGVKPHPLMSNIKGALLDPRGRALVDDHLRLKGFSHVFVIGDCASAPFAGMAQTAHEHGKHVARVIAAEAKNTTIPDHTPQEPAYAIPAGPWWAAVKYRRIRAYGWTGYLLRRAADLHVYALLLPWYKIPMAFFGLTNLKKYGMEPR